MSKPRNVQIALGVNGEPTEVAFAPYKTLLEVLREDLTLCGTKHGCELGECGACAVLLDDEPVLSCLVLGLECDGRQVTTVEGLATDGRLHPLQEAFADLGAAQCGYCTPGILVTAKALLDRHPAPTRDQIREALAGNLCRCTGYLQIFEAVEAAISTAAIDPPAGRDPSTKLRVDLSLSKVESLRSSAGPLPTGRGRESRLEAEAERSRARRAGVGPRER